jgi:hypothetical protein
VLHAGAHAVLRRSPSRPWRQGLHGPGEVDEVRALGVVEAQRAGKRVEDAVGGGGEIAALQAAVVGTLTPAKTATSSRRRPGTRRPP